MATKREIEVKVKSGEPDRVRRRLQSAGGVRVGAVREENTILDDADRSLLACDKGLRVRAVEVFDGPARSPTVTYKGPRECGSAKSREEVEVEVADASAARELLAALGFVECLTFQKRRETWRLGPCLVELDELPYLGSFVEVEGPDVESIDETLRHIGLSDEPVVQETYIALLLDHCRANDLPTDRIAFSRE